MSRLQHTDCTSRLLMAEQEERAPHTATVANAHGAHMRRQEEGEQHALRGLPATRCRGASVDEL